MAYISVEKMDKPQGYAMPEFHSHPYFEIDFLSKGKRLYFFADRTYKLESPALVIIPPNSMHRADGGPFVQYNVYVSLDYLDKFQQEVLESRQLHIITPLKSQNDEILKVLSQLSTVSDNRFRSEITHALFGYFMCLINELRISPLTANKLPRKDISTEIHQIVEFLNTNYSKKFTLDDIANTFFMSKSALNYKFKDATSCTPIEFLQNVRITAAKKMLTETAKSIKDISDQCGFSSPNYFGLIFKKKELISPAMYRKMYGSSKL